MKQEHKDAVARWTETLYPWAFGVLALAAGFGGLAEAVPGDRLRALLPTAVSVAAIVIGFAATSKSIIMAIRHGEAIETLRDVGVYHRSVSFFEHAIYGCFVTVLFSGFLMLYGTGADWAAAVWMGLAAFSACACLRIVRLFTKILRWEP